MSSTAPYRPVRRCSLAGPVILIVLGIIFLLGNFHYLSWPRLGYYFSVYWPLLLILWGVIKLLEHMSDQRHGVPGRGIGAGGVFLLIILIVCGLAATAAHRVNWGAVQNEMDLDSEFSGLFGNNYSFSQTVEQSFPAGSSLRVVSDRGDIAVQAWDQDRIKVVVTKKLVAANQEDSQKIDQQTQPVITSDGGVVTVNANTAGGGLNHAVQSNLQIWAPKAALDLATRRGDISVQARQGEVKLSSSRGNVSLQNITGNVIATMRRGDVHATGIHGDISFDGRMDDISVSDVSGTVRFSGDFFGQMNLSKIAKGVNFKSSRTDLEIGRLDGDMQLESGDLRVKSVSGPFRVVTRSKDIHLEDISGDVVVENSNGTVELHAVKPLGQITINNQKGDVNLTLPANSSFQAEVRAHQGDVESDFNELKVQNERQDNFVNGSVGTGGPRLQINNVYGDVGIRKG